MKTKKIFVIALVFFFALNIDAFAQRSPRGNHDGARMCLDIPELTQEQETKIKAIRTKRLNEATTHRAQMDELRAQKRTLRLAANPDMNEIEKVIDQMAGLRAEHMKASETHHQSIREILTPEQRTFFDSRTANRPRFEQRNMRRGQATRGEGRYNDQRPRGRRR